MRILLDTHILIYAAMGRLEGARKCLLTNEDNALFFSIFSLWELSKLVELKKLILPGTLEDFLSTLWTHPAYTVVSLTPKVLARAVAIAPKMHRDPADQVIVSSALEMEAALMSNDKLIKASGLVQVV